ncbi:MAG: spore coat associated protein CotJA [Eubacterium sp.]|nr:spore coat associated protein CotJA [Eubacterium sp.]MBQ8980039.1 spore coat associated protein CotJA [Eubacterium sp.]MBR1532028.1 spore coat associated protein CotJA [Eubacterium sp.]MBR2278831.1 spore coat associated protein CotJA [Eubacterium sp.]
MDNNEYQYLGTSKLPKDTVTTMAYVPFQTDTTQYVADDALKKGTLFKNLDKPFLEGRCK